MNTLIWILFGTLIISLISLIGSVTLFIKQKLLDKILLFLVSLSAGALMGGAFLHLIPEAQGTNVFGFVLVGFVLFFLIEKVLHWRHCHKGKCEVHPFVYMNLVGDGVHNFIDGLIIAASFMVDVRLGVITTFAVALHEIPQEIGDFGVLLYGGFNKIKALFTNFGVSITTILGGVIGYFISSQELVNFLLPFAAGGFIYISASDLLPEIKKETKLSKSLMSVLIFIIGILLMYGVKFIA